MTGAVFPPTRHSYRLTAPMAALYKALETRMAALATGADGEAARHDAAALLAAHDRLTGTPTEAATEATTDWPFPECDTPRLSVVLPLPRSLDATPLLDSLFLAWPDTRGSGTQAELLILTESGADAAALDGRTGAARLLTGAGATDSATALKAALKAARGAYIALIDPECLPLADWDTAALALLWPESPARPLGDVGLAAPRILYRDGRLYGAGTVRDAGGAIQPYGRDDTPFAPCYGYARTIPAPLGGPLVMTHAFAIAWAETGSADGAADATDTRMAYSPFMQALWTGPETGRLTPDAAARANAALHPMRDGSDRKRVLFIDYEVPRPDYNAGSYAAVQEARLFQALGYKVTFHPANRAWLGHYTADLQAEGVEVLYAPHVSDRETMLRTIGPEQDLIFLTRHYVARHFIGLIRRFAPDARVLFNNADLHFLRELRAALRLPADNERDRKERDRAMQQAAATRRSELAVMRASDLVFSYTDVEHAVIHSHLMGATDVVRTPWVVNPVTGEDVPAMADRAGLCFLGGYGHPPNVEAAHYLSETIMPLLRQALPGVALHLYGSGMTAAVSALADDDIHIHGQIDRVEDAYDRHRLFIAPLLSGAGIKGKVIGAIARGLPCVMTPLAAEGTGLSDGLDAAIKPDADALVAAIVALYEDPARWQAQQAAGLETIRARYSFDAGVVQMRAALTRLPPRPKPSGNA
ncbi:glycosyltransferase [Yunchengibacter salinarum]|uniref:glycosyltransferase n=1 Tax=Yunchengibacter salinarum TaxID=3133399 RepID=UPI0035B5E2E8